MSYGCGASDTCMSCYPLIYRCGACATDFPDPVPNGDGVVHCRLCGYDQHDPDSIENWEIVNI